MAGNADGMLPLVVAGGAYATGGEGVPEVAALAHPGVAGSWLPLAQRAMDAGHGFAAVVSRLQNAAAV